MREIKFRAWDMGKKRMVYFDEFERFGFINHKMDDTISLTGSVSLLLSTDPEYYIWLQFTGLKDKNGKKIYEGDILSLDGNLTADNSMGFEPNGFMFDETDIFIVVWNEELACWDLDFDRYEADTGEELPWKYKRDSRNLFISENIKIIGNIYENPELKP